MKHPRLINIGVAIIGSMAALIVLGQIVGAQTTVPRPNVAITRLPTLVYSVQVADFNNDGKDDLAGGYRDKAERGTCAVAMACPRACSA